MFHISNNQIITLTRGDVATTALVINLGTKLHPLIYDLGSLDLVYFAICEPNQPFEKAIVRKKYDYHSFDYDNHVLLINFKSEDTQRLVPGTYYYTVKLYRPETKKTDECVDTIISKKKFIIID